MIASAGANSGSLNPGQMMANTTAERHRVLGRSAVTCPQAREPWEERPWRLWLRMAFGKLKADAVRKSERLLDRFAFA